MIGRAVDRSPVPVALIQSMFAKYNDPAAGGATVLVAQDGDVFIDHAFGIPAQPRHMPRTTLPQFELGDIANVFTGICSQLPPPVARGRGAGDTTAAPAGGRGRGGPPPSPLQQCVSRVGQPVGAGRTVAPDSQHIHSSVDDLYRVSLGYESISAWRNPDQAKGWTADTYAGVVRLAAYATREGKRSAFVRIPSRKATIVILTNDPTADARRMSERILDRLLVQR